MDLIYRTGFRNQKLFTGAFRQEMSGHKYPAQVKKKKKI